MSLPVGARIGDTGLLVAAAYSALPSAPGGWTTAFTDATNNPQILAATKSLDATDISNGFITITPVTTEQTNMTLIVLQREAELRSSALYRQTISSDLSARAALASTGVSQFQIGVRAVQGVSNNATLTFVTPSQPSVLSNTIGTGSYGVGMGIGYFPFAVGSRSVDIEHSGVVSVGSLFLNLLFDVPVLSTPPPLRLKRSVNRGAMARAVR
jgi:hypothetical protein